MAKKKTKAKEKDKLKGPDEDFLEDVESVYPNLKGSNNEDSEIVAEEDEILEDEFEYEIEELPQKPEYKFLNLTLSRGTNINDYKLSIEGQSHGFLNILVKHLLTIEGVNSAAYKVTQIDNPEIFVRVEDGYKIKDVLHKGIQSLKSEVNEVQKLFKNLMK